MCYQILCTAIVEVGVVDPFVALPPFPPYYIYRGLSRQGKGGVGGVDRPDILVSPPPLAFPCSIVPAWLREEKGRGGGI